MRIYFGFRNSNFGFSVLYGDDHVQFMSRPYSRDFAPRKVQGVAPANHPFWSWTVQQKRNSL